MISDVAASNNVIDMWHGDPSCRDLVERAIRHDLVAATNAERRNEEHYLDRRGGIIFVPFSPKTYGALSIRSDFLVQRASLVSSINYKLYSECSLY